MNYVLVEFLFSFVRSVTMDKWKDIELEKMKVNSSSFKSGYDMTTTNSEA